MIITCPECSARYKIKDGLVQEKGKKVKCKKCGTVFIAYPGNKSVVKSSSKKTAPAASQPAPTPAPKPTPAPAPQAAAPMATVKVDRSKLDGFLNQDTPAAPKPEPVAKAEPAPASPSPAVSAPVDGQATIQVDRSQIDAYVKQAQKKEEPAPASDATVHIDRSTIEAAAREHSVDFEEDDSATVKVDLGALDQIPTSSANQDISTVRIDEQEPASNETVRFDVGDQLTGSETVKFDLSSMPTPGPSGGNMDTIKMDTGAIPPSPPADDDMDINFDTEDDGPIAGFDDKPDFGETPDFGDSPDFDTDPSMAPTGDDGIPEDINFDDASDEPAFPSDEELGIGSEAFDSSNDQALESTDPFASFDDETPQAPAFESSEPEPAPAGGEALYNARVDGQDYPNLTLESVGRWIQEGRLLESDQIDNGSGQYLAADQYPEIVPFFQQFYEAHGETPREPAAEKKGFMSKIMSIFKK